MWYFILMNVLRPGSVPHEPVPELNGINDDIRMEWHCRVPDSEICMVVADEILYKDGVGFTDFDEKPLDPETIPPEYLTWEYQAQLGKQVNALRFLGSTAI